MSHPFPPPPGDGPTGRSPGGLSFPPVPQTAPLAIVSLVTGLLGVVGVCLCLVGGAFGLVAVVCGLVARRQIAVSQGRLTGGGFAVGGIATGSVGLVLTVASLVLLLSGGATDLFRVGP